LDSILALNVKESLHGNWEMLKGRWLSFELQGASQYNIIEDK
jgi:hypothetical protein